MSTPQGICCRLHTMLPDDLFFHLPLKLGSPRHPNDRGLDSTAENSIPTYRGPYSIANITGTTRTGT